MKRAMLLVLFILGTTALAMAADDEAVLTGQMKKECASLFADGAPCSNLAKGNRKCVRQNLDKGGAACVAFEKGHKAYFDAGMNNDIIKNK